MHADMPPTQSRLKIKASLDFEEEKCTCVHHVALKFCHSCFYFLQFLLLCTLLVINVWQNECLEKNTLSSHPLITHM